LLFGKIAQAKPFLSYWLNAVDQHSLQAPFIYDFYTRVVKHNPTGQKIHPVQKLRQSLLDDQTIIEVTDFGTGKNKLSQRTISSLAKNSNRPKVSQLLHNMVDRYQSKVIVELGTNLGLSTLYLAMAAPTAEIITFEGCPEISNRAKRNFQDLGVEHIQIVTGPLDKTLDKILFNFDRIDLLFIDANHNYAATLQYFLKCLPKIHQKSIVVVDDIHWSKAMEKAWKQILLHDQVQLSVDLYQVGVVFFDQSLNKSHHILSW